MKKYQKKSLICFVCIYISIGIGCSLDNSYEGKEDIISEEDIIDPEEFRGKALLVIDIQEAYFTDDMADKNPGFMENVNILIEHFLKSDTAVIYIKNNGGDEFVSSVLMPEDKVLINKNERNAFIETNLQNYLNSNEIGTLYVAGLAAEYCIKETIIGAAKRAYIVIPVSDAIAAEGGELSKTKVLKELELMDVQTISTTTLPDLNR